ncbi:MAG: NAD(P)/FAD-dependent oxidoreductase [candidate division Zixibacteria bacterium]|nr:NAD(P)/FAD-dependent oxidoreductase [candidate division Zixibacteria bacterium]
MTDSYDVIVIGAGPAGSTAARFAASGGAKTLLLEKHPVIGYPLCCAEGITVSGLNRVVEPDPRWIVSKVGKLRMFGPKGAIGAITHPDAGYILERKIFDRDLANLASKAGAQVRVGVDVRDLLYDKSGKIVGIKAQANGSQSEIQAKVIIAADGVESEIALKAGIDSYPKPGQIEAAYQYLLGDVDFEPETLEFYFGTEVAPGGYIWVFCKGDALANVGISICPVKSPRKKAVEYLNEFIEKRFKRYTILERMTGGIPAYKADMPLYKDNLLLVGDAARVVDSLTGAGIANALLSGKVAGETAAKMISDGVSGEKYEKEFTGYKQKELKYYYLARELLLKMTDDDFESVIKFVDDMFGDRVVTALNPSTMIRKIILAHPRLLKLGRHLIF